jgi:hypothetical protein
MIGRRPHHVLVFAAAAWIAAVVAVSPQTARQRDTLPTRLSNAEFWRLSTTMSEPNGHFRSENLVSNEHTFQYVIPALKKVVRPGAVYLGVAPDQNFTYMIATQPRMAFIVDIRRGNLLQHLLYKALIEMSADRAEFISRLFSKPRPAGLSAKATVVELFTAYSRVATGEDLYRANLRAIVRHLTDERDLPLTAADLEQIESIYFAFFWEGPGLRYSTSPTGLGGQRFGTNFPTYEELMMQTDWDGVPRSYLATEENFRFIKTLQEKNLIVPVIGNFAGPKALRAVGRYIRERGAVVSAYYVSNVEQYLFQDGLFDEWADNVATLPIDDASTFIRSVSMRFGYGGTQVWTDGRASALDPIRTFIRDAQVGRIRSYYDLNARSR